MCEDCFEEEIHSFDDYETYQAFDRTLTNKMLKGHNLHMLEASMEYRRKKFSLYVCTRCEEQWTLSEPKDTWKGFFMTLENAKAYLDALSEDERQRNRGCFALIAIIVLIIVLMMLGIIRL